MRARPGDRFYPECIHGSESKRASNLSGIVLAWAASAPRRLGEGADQAVWSRRDGIVGEGRAQHVVADAIELFAVAAVDGRRAVRVVTSRGEPDLGRVGAEQRRQTGDYEVAGLARASVVAVAGLGLRPLAVGRHRSTRAMARTWWAVGCPGTGARAGAGCPRDM
jgi:hypothetical protein